MSHSSKNTPNGDETDHFVNANEIDEVVDDNFPETSVPDAAAHPDGRNLVGSEDTTDDHIEIDMRNNSTTYFDQHTDSVYLIASHPTLPLAVSGGGDNLAYIWTTTHTPPRLAATLSEPTESVIAGGFTANGKYLVIGDMSGRLLIYKSNSTGEKWNIMSNTQEVNEIVHISFHPELSMFAVGASDGSIWCYEITEEVSNLSVLYDHSLPTTATTFVPSNALEPKLFSVSEDGLMILWDVYSGREIYKLGPPQLRGEHPWVSLAVSPTGLTVAVGSMDGLVVLVKLADGTLLRTVDTTVVKPEVKASSSKDIEMDSAQADQQDVEPEEEEEEEEDGRSVEGLCWSNKTNLLATGNVDGTVVLWDTQTWRPRTHFQVGDAVTNMQFVPNTSLLVVSSMDGVLSQYDAINGTNVWSGLGHSEGILGFTLQNAGKRIISASDDQVCLIFNLQ